MDQYTPTIGLEIHAALRTATKMFCNSANDPDEKDPNTNICPICLGHPGTLPTINKAAVKHVLKVGLAVGGTLADFTEFDRKNYFYPDIPKGYQISQYKHPLVSGGELAGIAITRIHLEEDTARSTHDRAEASSLVDFNRAGVPLMELVTEPVIHSAADAVRFAREFQLILQYLGAGNANLEKGEMRIEANISVSKNETFGTKVEVKNLNSFVAVSKAIECEVARHIELLERGESVAQETRGWDESKGSTFSQRLKEDSHDYRYFPDPDLPKLHVSQIPEFEAGALLREIPELPNLKRSRYIEAYGLKVEDVEVFVRDRTLGTFFEQVVSSLGPTSDPTQVKLAANYILSDLLGQIKNDPDNSARENPNPTDKVSVEHFAKLIEMIATGAVSSRGAKDILARMYATGDTPMDIANTQGLLQESDEEKLKEFIRQVIAAEPAAVEEYRSGKASALQFLVGQAMKISRGSANPVLLASLFTDTLSEGSVS
jgi:aspartyl-tRNA(Asn)/glutamyl-tRNA(Gln) amidotransferase subunit B